MVLRRARRPPSVLVGMAETSGYCSQLAEGLRSIGVRADHVNLGPDPFGYASGAGRPLVRLVRGLARRRAQDARPRVAWKALHRVAMTCLFVDAMVRYDAFVFRAGDSFFALRDLPLLRRLGKRIIVVFFGTDSRPVYMSGAEVARGVVGREAARVTAGKRALVERIERSASEIVCHVMTAQLHRRRAVAFLHVGIPRRVPSEPVRPMPEAGVPRTMRVLHAPSNPAGKGTAIIREAVERVRARGIDVELTILTGRPNHEVLEALDRCDFVIDEVHSDTAMAGFAAEAAARGRPAVVGGYGWDELRRLTPDDVLPPSHLAHPDRMEEAIARLAEDHAYRRELGARARTFIEERWSPHAVAERMLRVIDGSAPPDWRFDPRAVIHPYGAGITVDALRRSVRSVLDEAGREGLRVTDKPELEGSLLALALAADPE